MMERMMMMTMKQLIRKSRPRGSVTETRSTYSSRFPFRLKRFHSGEVC